ncbi:MAG: VapE family protein, partial [Pseudanabaenaceae cyanobacterium bins.68]|nr:VapE family protein [Pseudanabaenaceae cyanobacterium bins.68]
TKGIDDYAVAHGHQALAKLVEAALPFEAWRKQTQENEPDKVISRKQQEIKNLRKIYADRLKLNLRGNQVELDTQPIKPDYLYLQALEDYGLCVGKDLIIDAFLLFASQREYDPVKDYLEQCYAKYGDSTIHLLDNAANRYLGTEEPINNTYLKKTLVGAVKRTYEPGCKFDTALVFQGKQGLGKSTFWRVLAGDQWFDDNVCGFEKDDKQLLHKYWIEELGEIEKISNKNDVSVIKAFLSRQYDNFRIPFGRSTQSFARKFIIVGSCNNVEFLQDSTGDRRFWVIPITTPIDIEAVRVQRDQLWAAAVALYKQGESVYLSQDLDQVREELNKYFRSEDPWEDPIREFVANLSEVKTSDILTDCLKLDLDRQDRRSQNRVAEILRNLEWEKVHTMKGKKWLRKKQGSCESLGHNPDAERDAGMTHISIDESSTVSVGHIVNSKPMTHDPYDPCKSSLPEKQKSEFHAKKPIKPGDRVEILKGSLRGQVATVEAIAGDTATIRGKTWVFSNQFALGDLRWVKS